MATLKKSEHSYKCCFVPMCKNTTVSTPEKIFFNVPSTADIRKQWFDAAHREDKVSAKTKCFACEDHFIVSNYKIDLLYFNTLSILIFNF